jgi:hypothetical protein
MAEKRLNNHYIYKRREKGFLFPLGLIFIVDLWG